MSLPPVGPGPAPTGPFAGPAPYGPAAGAPTPRRSKVRARVIVLVLVAALVVVLVPLLLLWGFTRNGITAAAADLPEDICATVHDAVGDDDTTLDYVENDLDDRSYAVCRATTLSDGPEGVVAVTVRVSRMAGTKFAFALSRAGELADAFCAGSDVGRTVSPGGVGLTSLGGSSACVSQVVDADSGNVTVALAGAPPGHDDTFVGITYQMAGDQDDVDTTIAAAERIVRRVTLRL